MNIGFIKNIINIKFNNIIANIITVRKSLKHINYINFNLSNKNNNSKIIIDNTDININNYTRKNYSNLFNNSLNNLVYNKNFNITAINYANSKFKNSQKLNSFTAIKYGEVNQTIEYNQNNISSSFLKANKEILSMKKGGGYWLWKPYFILKTLKEKVKNNDYLIYSDSGSIYINSVYNLLYVMIRDKIDIISFHVRYKQKYWTKRDVFLLMNCDTPKYTESKQVMGGFILMKNNNFIRSFINEWLEYAQDKRMITDQPNVLGKPNYPGFRENRHDQSIFSILITKYNISSYRDPSNFGIYQNFDIKNNFPTIFYSTRSDSFTSLEEIIKSKEFNEFNSIFKKNGSYTLQKFVDSIINKTK